MSIVGFPLLLIPLAIVNIIAFLMPGVSLGSPLYAVPLLSKTSWTITFSDALLAFGMLMLFFEVAKTARPGGKYFTDHLLSVLLFGAATAEFLLLPQFGNSTFFLLTMLTLIDVISGIAIRMRQRGFVEAKQRASRKVKAPRSEPSVVGAPVSESKPHDASTHDSVLDLDRPVASHESSAPADESVGGHDRPATTAAEAGGELIGDQPLEPRR